MPKKIITFLVIATLVAVGGYLIFDKSIKPESKPHKTPVSTVKSFYNTWINYEAEDILEGTYRDSELITDNFIERIEAAKKVDPVLCSQDLPKHFEVSLKAKSATSSTLTVKEYFKSNTSKLEVSLIKKEGSWLINDVNCSPAAKKKGDFAETGNLVKDLPGLEEKGWFLSYEREGEPGLAVKLKFDQESTCNFEDKEGTCQELLGEEFIGTRVKVEGEKQGKEVLVFTLSEQ